MDDLQEIDYHAWALRTAQRARAGVLTLEELLQVAEEVMHHQQPQAACPRAPQGFSLDQRPVLKGRMTNGPCKYTEAF